MLIINADDFGRSEAATDNALSCYTRNRITSTSATVFMEGSQRPAELALASGINTGLHINFSEGFTRALFPSGCMIRKSAYAEILGSNKYVVLSYNPWLRREFGRAPSQLDGHQPVDRPDNASWDEGSKKRFLFAG